MSSPKHIYRNAPQLKAQLIDAQITVCRWGRGTGKSRLGGYWTANRALRMARSGNAIGGPTYTHLLTKVAPGIVQEWNDLGYKEGVHYWLWKMPPKSFRIPMPYQPILSPAHTVFWWNGSITQFLSAERGLNNGLNADSMYFDEARLIAADKIREISLTVRGNHGHFGDMSCHGSMLFTSDAPRSARSQWLNDYEKQMNAPMIDAILQAAVQMHTLKMELMQAKSERKRIALASRIAWYEAWLNEARKEQVYFSRASTLDNAHAIGLKAIKNFQRILSPEDYRISVLNLDRASAPSSFYPMLNEEVHGFHSEDSSFVESLGFSDSEKNCLWKSKAHYDRSKPLDIAMDYNNAINSLVVGQGDALEYRLLNSFFVLGTDKLFLADVVRKFANFYGPHTAKVVNYYYDHTAVFGDARGRMSFCDEVVDVLGKQGWTVIRHRINQASRHDHRFQFWQRMLGEAEPMLPRFRFDLDDAAAWHHSATNAEAKPSDRGGFKKDKSSETRKDRDGNYALPPEESTHLSEACDTLIDGKFGRMLMGNAPFIA